MCLKKNPTEYVIEYEIRQGCYKRINYKTTITLLNWDSFQIIHYSPIDVLAIKDCDDLMDISITAEKLRKLHLLWHPYNKSSSVGSLKILAPNLENFRWGGHVVDYHFIEDFSTKLNLITALRLSDQLYESLTKYHLKGIPIE